MVDTFPQLFLHKMNILLVLYLANENFFCILQSRENLQLQFQETRTWSYNSWDKFSNSLVLFFPYPQLTHTHWVPLTTQMPQTTGISSRVPSSHSLTVNCMYSVLCNFIKFNIMNERGTTRKPD